MTNLRGMTWNHARGVDSVEAATAAFGRHAVVWEARSLAEFEDTPIAELAARYDLLAIDHPHTGQAVAEGALLDLSALDVVADLRANAVGASLRSYELDGGLWALPMDAAAQVAAYRADLLGEEPPRSFPEALDLMRRVPSQFPANPTHLWSTFLSLCHEAARAAGSAPDGDAGAGGRPSWWPASGIEPAVASDALGMLRELLAVSDPVSLERDPIEVLEAMAAGEPIAYVPLIFGYSNYSRAHRVRFADAPLEAGTLLGGVGLAISSRCADPAAAVELASWIVSRECQTGVFTRAGGQPGHRAAWLDPELDALTHGFFSGTLATLDRAFVRDRRPGYPAVQRRGSEVLHAMVVAGERDTDVIAALADVWGK